MDGTSEMDGSITITNMEHEMYNDGLFFLGKSNSCEGTFEKWRYQRFAIISFCTSFESFLHKKIVSKLTIDDTVVEKGSDILNYLSDPESKVKRPFIIATVKGKLRVLADANGLDQEAFLGEEFKEFEKIIHLRNKIVHFSRSNFDSVYLEMDNLVEVAPEFLRSLVMIICEELNENVPGFYLETEYKDID
ncbi:hypothetical protein BTO30_16690 [Domibacillus antri]|uniref:Uncharacterized protein n=1 Tax=Domibacillus antri TaxID=1714264 RepID=A0A1Q8Q197_9BACI|nr:hypothetical protein [Domibacillus antri]OLN21114.1 hypothetical protein BTO30_16690 [Domibacillus antri]